MEFPAPPRVHILHVPGVDPDRDAIVAKLRDQADACVHEDPDRIGCAPNWLRAMQCAVKTDISTWSIVLSDDADPLPGWQQHLERACKHSPAPVLGLTHFGGYGEKPIAAGAPYGVGPYLLWGGAIAYHVNILRPLTVWAARIIREHNYPHDDCLVAAFMLKSRHQTAMCARAIFGQPVKASLLNHNTPIRSPKTTILDAGPPWSSSPRSVRVSRGISPKNELERLAAL